MKIDAQLPLPQTGSQAAGPEGVDQAVVGAPAAAASEFFISPVLRFDSRSLTVIFQVRDSRSGDVIRQFPPETVVARYRQDASARPFVLPAPGGGNDATASAEPDFPGEPRADPDGGSEQRGAAATAADREQPSAPVDLVA